MASTAHGDGAGDAVADGTVFVLHEVETAAYRALRGGSPVSKWEPCPGDGQEAAGHPVPRSTKGSYYDTMPLPQRHVLLIFKVLL